MLLEGKAIKQERKKVEKRNKIHKKDKFIADSNGANCLNYVILAG